MASEVRAWQVSVMCASQDRKITKDEQAVFITEGTDLAQLQREVEMKFGMTGQRLEIREIKSLGPIGNQRV